MESFTSEQAFLQWCDELPEEEQKVALLVKVECSKFHSAWRCAMELVGPVDYDDVFQECITAFYEAKGTYKDGMGASFGSWVWTNIKRRLSTHLVRRFLRPEERMGALVSQLIGGELEPRIPFLEDAVLYAEAVLAATTLHQQWELLRTYWEGFIGQLSQRDQEIIQMRLDCKSVTQIAADLQCKQPIVSRRLSVILEKYERYTGCKEALNAG